MAPTGNNGHRHRPDARAAEAGAVLQGACGWHHVLDDVLQHEPHVPGADDQAVRQVRLRRACVRWPGGRRVAGRPSLLHSGAMPAAAGGRDASATVSLLRVAPAPTSQRWRGRGSHGAQGAGGHPAASLCSAVGRRGRGCVERPSMVRRRVQRPQGGGRRAWPRSPQGSRVRGPALTELLGPRPLRRRLATSAQRAPTAVCVCLRAVRAFGRSRDREPPVRGEAVGCLRGGAPRAVAPGGPVWPPPASPAARWSRRTGPVVGHSACDGGGGSWSYVGSKPRCHATDCQAREDSGCSVAGSQPRVGGCSGPRGHRRARRHGRQADAAAAARGGVATPRGPTGTPARSRSRPVLPAQAVVRRGVTMAAAADREW